MKASHHHKSGHHAGNEPLRPVKAPTPQGTEIRIEPVAKTASVSPIQSEPPAPWPSELFLIGCGEAPITGVPSAKTMGNKAWNLLRMAQLALPVPAAFVLGTRFCMDPAARRLAGEAEVWQGGMRALERASGLVFGDARRPLLLSVRSGAPVSMPGMMETLLNIGLADATVGGLLRQTGNPRLVWDAYRRLIATHGEVVAGLPAQLFDDALQALAGSRDERELDFSEMRTLTQRFLSVYAQASGRPFPQDPREQLAGAIEAVFASWNSAKASEYRRINRIPDAIGTAVTVQRMVFGNGGGQSGAGVGFTRDPATGEPSLWVDFLFNAQGEDVVSGRRSAHGHDELATVLPTVWAALQAASGRLEQAFGDMQDFEFTVQEGQLFMLQTRDGKRTPRAAARIALDMHDEKLIDLETARARTATSNRETLSQPRVVAADGVALSPIARAPAASTGVATGEIALDGTRAIARHATGVAVVLVRRNAETSDIAALEAADGLLTQRGARTSHAAVVARQLGKVCLIGCAELQIDEVTRSIRFGDKTLGEGDVLTLDGNDGTVYAGAVRTEMDCPADLLTRLAALNAT